MHEVYLWADNRTRIQDSPPRRRLRRVRGTLQSLERVRGAPTPWLGRHDRSRPRQRRLHQLHGSRGRLLRNRGREARAAITREVAAILRRGQPASQHHALCTGGLVRRHRSEDRTGTQRCFAPLSPTLRETCSELLGQLFEHQPRPGTAPNFWTRLWPDDVASINGFFVGHLPRREAFPYWLNTRRVRSFREVCITFGPSRTSSQNVVEFLETDNDFTDWFVWSPMVLANQVPVLAHAPPIHDSVRRRTVRILRWLPLAGLSRELLDGDRHDSDEHVE